MVIDFMSGRATHSGRYVVFGVFVCLYFFVALVVSDGRQGWGDDFAFYIAQARAIVESGSLTDPDYVFNPDALGYSPLAYPPGLPVMLAAGYAMFGLDIQSLKVLVILSACLGFIAVYLLFNRMHSPGMAFAVVLIFALNPYVWSYQQYILSEFPYIMGSFCALYFVHLAYEKEARARLLCCLIAGALIFAAVMTRTVGLTLLLACITYGILNFSSRPKRNASLLIVATFCLLYLLFDISTEYATHDEDVVWLCASCLPMNLYFYYQGLIDFLSAGGALPGVGMYRDVICISGILLTLSGLGLVVRRAYQKRLHTEPVWQRFLASFSPVDIYFCGTILLIFLLPVHSTPRFLLPLLPIALFYILVSLLKVASGTRGREWALSGAAMGFLCLYAAVYATYLVSPDRQQSEASVTSPDAQALFEFITNNIEDTDLIIAPKPRALVLFTRRRATVFDGNVGPENLMADIEERGVTHLVFGKTKRGGMYASDWILTHPVIATNFVTVFENAQFRVLETAR